MSKEQKQLAEAMSKLAAALENWQDPVLWQKIIQDALRTGALPPQALAGIPSEPGAIGRIEAVSVVLSDEEREGLAAKIHEALQPQLADFNDFVKESLKEIPAGRLKALAEKIEAGEKPRLRRRQGCVFVEFESGDDIYLGL